MKDLITALLAAKAAGTSSGIGMKGDKGDPGPAGSDANVTADNIAAALGYTPVKPSDIPTALKNPNAITFTGAATGSYDGSAEMFVHIPPATATLEPPPFAPSLEWLKENGNSSKTYVLPDGYLYAMQEGTSANFTNLFDPSTAELNTAYNENNEPQSAPGYISSDLIPATFSADLSSPTVIRIRGLKLMDGTSPYDVCFYYDADKNTKWYGSMKSTEYSRDENDDIVIRGGYWKDSPLSFIGDIRYFRISGSVYGGDDSIIYTLTEDDIKDIIITVDQEIEYTTGLQWMNTGIKYTSSSEISPLQEKNVLIIGDSISTDVYGNYNKWVTALQNTGFFPKGTTDNNSVSSTGFVIGDGNNFVDRLTAVSNPENFDLVVVFGGINDYMRSVPMGASGGDKETEFIPAVDYFFKYLVTNFINARIAVLSPLRYGADETNSTGKYQADYASYIREAAKRYCLPVLNLTDESGFCPAVNAFAQKWTNSADSLHPNAEYQERFLAPLIKGFLSDLYGG